MHSDELEAIYTDFLSSFYELYFNFDFTSRRFYSHTKEIDGISYRVDPYYADYVLEDYEIEYTFANRDLGATDGFALLFKFKKLKRQESTLVTVWPIYRFYEDDEKNTLEKGYSLNDLFDCDKFQFVFHHDRINTIKFDKNILKAFDNYVNELLLNIINNFDKLHFSKPVKTQEQKDEYFLDMIKTNMTYLNTTLKYGNDYDENFFQIRNVLSVGEKHYSYGVHKFGKTYIPLERFAEFKNSIPLKHTNVRKEFIDLLLEFDIKLSTSLDMIKASSEVDVLDIF